MDIVERMRTGEPCADPCKVRDAKSGCCCTAAADAIERLRAALKDLLDCLDLAERNDDLPVSLSGYGHDFIEKARAALSSQ